MSAFADTSALLKLYADEFGHETVRELSDLLIARVTRVEIPAALWRKQRMGELPQADVRLLIDGFEADYFGTHDTAARYIVVGLTNLVLEDAAHNAAVHGLGAYDAVQLASACAARSAYPECRSMAVFDKQLRAAAAAEGFQLVPAD